MTLENAPRSQQSSASPAFTLRLTFAYDPQGIRLIRTQRVEMIAPPSHTGAQPDARSGYWFEVRGPQGDLYYRRAVYDPTHASIEVFSDDPKQPLMRVPNPNRTGEFDLLVPDVPNAASFVLYGPPTGALPEEQSKELVRYPFEQLRRS